MLSSPLAGREVRLHAERQSGGVIALRADLKARERLLQLGQQLGRRALRVADEQRFQAPQAKTPRRATGLGYSVGV